MVQLCKLYASVRRFDDMFSRIRNEVDRGVSHMNGAMLRSARAKPSPSVVVGIRPRGG